MTRPVRILTVCTSDDGGGAERVARDLHEAYRAAGNDAWLAVGTVRRGGEYTRQVPNRAHRNAWARVWMAAADALPQRNVGFRLARLLRGPVAEPRRWFARSRGEEDFDQPGTHAAFATGGVTPDVVHLHNLHGDYFDLSVLPDWSTTVPTVVSLHDAWMLSGHCSHPFGCERWKTGCGECPALWIHPAVPRDATAFNWRRKRDIYAHSALHIGVPCEWLAGRVRESSLAAAVRSMRVIPYGVDLSIYRPTADRAALRRELGLDPARPVFLAFANALAPRTWKDATLFGAAVARLGRAAAGAQWIVIGGADADPRVGGVRFRRVMAERDDRKFARWFQVADAYVHPARADTFPLVNLEAQACGAPVVATAVDGIPEQLVSAAPADVVRGTFASTATGLLSAAGDAVAFARSLDAVAEASPESRSRLSAQAAAHAKARFDSTRYTREYESWLHHLATS